jgi:hypothetical protein
MPNSAALEVCQDILFVQIIVLELGSLGAITGWTVSPIYAGCAGKCLIPKLNN